MSGRCEECGAVLREHASCETIFNACLALEFSDRAYGEVHMLTVACFMIQHGRYSPAALADIAEKLRAGLEEGLSPERIRRQAAAQASQAERTWKVTRQPGDPSQPRIAWSRTIAEIPVEEGDPAAYRAAVRRWAWATLEEMHPLLPAKSP